MYTAFFNLKEIPFSIAPNPAYLFMSDRHREALTHLTHGLGDTGGFVLLTGEVGTGKTTISRCLMEQLPDNIQSAFILNPTLSSHELLATLCDELKIRYRKTGATLKTLTDKIQGKLLSNHEKNINTLLIVDEAQHLQPEVLEQLRLLTNLETNTKKLLQVILIGQPELQALLRRRDLRQLAQRITARYHLLPLNKEETAHYIKHRLSVAECHRPLFNKAAIATIHQLSQGIPRLINLLCDRSLMNAYNANDAIVSKQIVVRSSVEALGEQFLPDSFWHKAGIKPALTVATVIIVLLLGFWLGQEKNLVDQSSIIVKQSHINDSQLIAENNNDVSKDKNLAATKADDLTETVAQLNKSIEHIKQRLAEQEQLKKQQSNKNIAKENVEINNSSKKQEVLSEPIKSDELVNNAIEPEIDYQVNEVEGVSEDLLTRFQSAIDETNNGASNNSSEINKENILPLSDMPSWVQEGVPSLNFEMHIYSSDEGAGWVRVNGRDRYEGDKVSQDLFVSEILPQKVVLTYRGEKFTLPALSSW